MSRTTVAQAVLLLTALVHCTVASSAEQLRRAEPGKRLHVFILAGQSNMEGRADGLSLSQQDRERLRKAQPRVQLVYNQRPAQDLDVVAPPDDIKEIYHVERIFGPELFFGVTLAEAWPAERILLIKVAVGATSLYGSWNPAWTKEQAAAADDTEAPHLYDTMVSRVKQTLSPLRPDEYTVHAMFWVQGESDSRTDAIAGAYGNLLRTLIERVRKDFQVPNLPFVLLDVGNDKVVEGMRRTAAEVPHVTLLRHSADPSSPEYLPTIPNGHFNHEGMKRIGTRFAETYLRISKE